MPTNAELNEELKALRKDMQEGRMVALGKTFDQFITRDMKSYEDNFRITGFRYDVKEAQKDSDDGKDAFNKKVLDIFVRAKVLPADQLFFTEGKDKGKLRPGVLRNLHPLSQKSNAPIVVAFTQS